MEEVSDFVGIYEPVIFDEIDNIYVIYYFKKIVISYNIYFIYLYIKSKTILVGKFLKIIYLILYY